MTPDLSPLSLTIAEPRNTGDLSKYPAAGRVTLLKEDAEHTKKEPELLF